MEDIFITDKRYIVEPQLRVREEERGLGWVIAHDSDGTILVAFDDAGTGHGGHCFSNLPHQLSNNCWWARPYSVELVDEAFVAIGASSLIDLALALVKAL